MRIREVGPRDGFQNQPDGIPAVFEIAERLVAAGATAHFHNTRGQGLGGHTLLAGRVDWHR